MRHSVVALIFTVFLFPAHAQDPTGLPELPKVPEKPKWLEQVPLGGKGPNVPAVPVPWRITVFEDLPQSPDCEEVLGLRGQCFEEVRFVDPAGLQGDSQGASNQIAQLRGLSIQFARVWEGLTYRWAVEGDPIAESIVAAGYTTIPSPADTWEARRAAGRSGSVPELASWLQERAWIEDFSGSAGFFPRVRYQVAAASHAPPHVVLHGRFASRLGFDGRPYDYDLMDGDPRFSKPFFEQMYPYSAHDAAGVERPLAPFELPLVTDAATLEVAVAPLRLADTSFARFRVSARSRFADFYALLATQVAQFALEDYTQNQMRVLAALAAMETGPRADIVAGGGGRQIVAAARGETDDAAEQAKRIARAEYTPQALDLNFLSIPLDTVSHFVVLLYARVLEDATVPTAVLDAELERFAVQTRVIRPGAPVLADPRAAAMTQWAGAWVVAGVPPEQVVATGQRVVLAAMLEDLSADTELLARFQTAILLDQVQRAVVSTFDATPGARAAPQDVVSKVVDKWARVLGPHGFAPRLVPQGLGAVDPTAICTTLDGTGALSEPAFGAVNLDVLVVAPDRGAISFSELVAETREKLPFLLMDNPSLVKEDASTLRLIGLPGAAGQPRALYRIRWRVWTGWHLFWTEERLSDGGSRLAVRTGAVCDDTTIAPPELVPTLLRASLLEGDFRSPTPVPFKLGRAPAAAGGPVDAPAIEARTALEELKRYLLAPIDALASEVRGVLLVVADLNDPARPVALGDLVPRTPYARLQVPAGAGQSIVSAAWGRFFMPGAAVTAPVVYPAFRPGQSVGSDSLYPRWPRNPVSNFTFSAGAGYFPIRAAQANCLKSPTSPGFVGACAADDRTLTHSEGFSADLQGLTTRWLLDQPRVGVEAGLEVRLDASHSGTSWTYPDDGGPSQTWMFRAAAGALVGIRAAPLPGPLTGGSAGSVLWGADRADGSSRLARVEYGLRTGFLLAPGYYGTEGTILGEAWIGRSARRTNAPLAHLTPYNPGALYGLFVRGQYGFTLGQAVEQGVLRRSGALVMGLRGTWDFQVELPEAPKPE